MRENIKKLLTVTVIVSIVCVTVSIIRKEGDKMIHDNVEKFRKAKGVTMTHLADKLNLTLQGYRHIATGNVRLDAERLKIIGLVLDVDPGIFFDDKLTDSVILKINNETKPCNYTT